MDHLKPRNINENDPTSVIASVAFCFKRSNPFLKRLLRRFAPRNDTIILGFIFSVSLCTHAYADASIVGIIKYDGSVPHSRLIHMDADPICYAVNKGNVHSQSIILGDNNTLRDVFVYIKSGLNVVKLAQLTQAVVINQAGCNYSPHVIGVMVGQKVIFLNPDGTLHNVHGMCKVNPEFDVAMPNFRKEMQISFDKPEFMFPIRCDVHPWMTAWMAVMSHPFFTVTKSDGKFELKNLPAGTYEIEAWHEKLGSKTATVTLAEGRSQTLDFTFSSLK